MDRDELLEELVEENTYSEAFLYCLEHKDKELLSDYIEMTLGSFSDEGENLESLFEMIKKYPMLAKEDIASLVEMITVNC